MMRRIKIYTPLLLIILTLGATVQAGQSIYKQVLPNGQVIYSNVSEPGATEINLPPVNLMAAPPNVNPDPSADPSQPPAEATLNYQLAFIQPKNEQVYTAVEQTVEINLNIKPELNKTDRIRLFIDGQVYGGAQSGPNFVISDLDRGTHILEARIYSDTGIGEAKATSAQIAIHIQKNIVKKTSPYRAP